MNTYRTLKEATALRDNSNHTLKFNRTIERGEWQDDDAPTGAAIVWGLFFSVVMLAVLVAVFV